MFPSEHWVLLLLFQTAGRRPCSLSPALKRERGTRWSSAGAPGLLPRAPSACGSSGCARPCPAGRNGHLAAAAAGSRPRSLPSAPHSPAWTAVSPPSPLAPRSYPGEKAGLVAPAPLRSCRNLGSEKRSDRLSATRAVGELGWGPRPTSGGPRGREAGPPPTERAAEGRAGTVGGAPPARAPPLSRPPRRASGWDHVTPHVTACPAARGGAVGSGGLLRPGARAPADPGPLPVVVEGGARAQSIGGVAHSAQGRGPHCARPSPGLSPSGAHGGTGNSPTPLHSAEEEPGA